MTQMQRPRRGPPPPPSRKKEKQADREKLGKDEMTAQGRVRGDKDVVSWWVGLNTRQRGELLMELYQQKSAEQ